MKNAAQTTKMQASEWRVMRQQRGCLSCRGSGKRGQQLFIKITLLTFSFRGSHRRRVAALCVQFVVMVLYAEGVRQSSGTYAYAANQ